jgi:Mn2+/Fe2+ NRAMP family transporter
LDVTSPRFKLITGVASLLALCIPILGFNPIQGQIITQVFNVFALPMVVFSFLYLWNRKNEALPSNRLVTNLVMIAAFLFSLIILWNGLSDILN